MDTDELARLRRACRQGDAQAAHTLRRHAERTHDDALRSEADAGLVHHAVRQLAAGHLEPAVDAAAGVAITAATFDRAGHRACVEVTTGGLRVFDLVARRRLAMRTTAGQSQVLWGGARSTSITPDGDVLVTRGVWGNDITTIELDSMRAFDNGYAYGATMVTTFSLDGRTLLVGSCDHNDDDDDADAPRSALQAWQRRGARTGTFLWSRGVDGQVDALAYASDTRLFVATRPTARRRVRPGHEGRLALLELHIEPGRQRHTAVRPIGALELDAWPELATGVRDLHVHARTGVAALCAEAHVLVLDVSVAGRPRARAPLEATCAAIAPCGRYLITGTRDGGVHVLDATSLEPVAHLDVDTALRADWTPLPPELAAEAVDDDEAAHRIVAVSWSTEHELWAAVDSGQLISWPLWVAMQP